MIEHSNPTLGIKEKQALAKAIDQNYIAEGNQTHCFEKELSEYIGVKGGVATSTGTLGLHLALSALDLKKNDEVIIPSYTCRSVLNAVLYSGLTPILCDVDIENYNISFNEAKKVLSKNTKAIIIPHMFGCPVSLDKFKKLKVPIIEDCAHSIGAKYKGQKVGSIGDLSLFSFEGTKYIVTGEGGMVLTGSNRLLKILKKLKEPNSIDCLTKYTYRMSDLQATVGRVQLKRLEGFIRKRRSIAKIYDNAFKSCPVLLPKNQEYSRHIYQRYMIQIQGNINTFIKICLKKGIKVKQPVKPYALHKYLGLPSRDYPNTEHIMRSAVSIPIYPSLTNKQVDFITRTIRRILEDHAK
ncbi:MAG: DegT/DnrJ/EryC1/StrS aminotransferase family protein [Candidatus Omnitrophica bacterium]|nr:DegT/DnrJ/EryC1/StrS aminotransferase family protein [Candidatus Omnitrophota bacterium]MBU1996693.1 DegT/DnrJ/EryC1/StrS aminotransferase family protein [Candidatus Omnitrophota bacterium]